MLPTLFVPCRDIACRARGIFCDQAGLVAAPWEIRCRRTRSIRPL